jgi:2'-hydroxyisoflavone reductase
VEAALARGHAVTLFNRGRSGPGLFGDVEHLAGDRDGGLEPLRGRTWDAVVDTSGFVPRVVRQSAELLAAQAGVYAFVSSGSVYPLDGEDRSEDGPVIELDDPATEDVMAAYGGLKALCEEVVGEVYDERALNVRSGLIVGPHDPTGRFTYWATRLARGGEVLAPGAPDREVQFIDARDEAAWILDMVEAGRGGTFNVCGPSEPLTLGGLLAHGDDPDLTWVGDAFLQEHGVEPYSEMPLWVPPGLGTINMPIDRALVAGLRTRDLADTLAATRAWAATAADPSATDAGGRVRRPSTLTPEREAELLEAWHRDGRRA